MERWGMWFLEKGDKDVWMRNTSVCFRKRCVCVRLTYLFLGVRKARPRTPGKRKDIRQKNDRIFNERKCALVPQVVCHFGETEEWDTFHISIFVWNEKWSRVNTFDDIKRYHGETFIDVWYEDSWEKSLIFLALCYECRHWYFYGSKQRDQIKRSITNETSVHIMKSFKCRFPE